MLTRHLPILVLALLMGLVAPVMAQDSPVFDGRSVEDWSKRLEGRFTRSAARRALGEGGTEALPVMRALIRSGRPVVSGHAAEALRPLGPDGAPALPELVVLLKTAKDKDDRVHAIRAVTQMGTMAAPAISKVIEALKDPEQEVRGQAATTLGLLAPVSREAIPALTSALGDTQETVRRQAASALGKMGAAAIGAAEAITKLLDDEQPYTRQAAATALWRIGPGAVDHLLVMLRAGQSKIVVPALTRGGEDAVPLLVGLLSDKDRQVSAAAADALVGVGWLAIPALRKDGRGELARRILEEFPKKLIRVPDDKTVHLGDVPRFDARSVAINWETGSGHGGSLSVGHLRWAPDGLIVERFRYVNDRKSKKPLRDRITVERGLIPESRALALIETLAHVSAMRLVEKPREPGIRGGRSWSSTANIHISLRMEAGSRRILEGQYTGYRRSATVPLYFRISIANRILQQSISGVEFDKGRPRDSELDHLKSRLEYFEDDGWWVQERLLHMIEVLGDKRFVPFLRDFISTTPGKTVRRRHVYAIDAYARITGKDLRTQPFNEKNILEVRQRYLELWQ